MSRFQWARGYGAKQLQQHFQENGRLERTSHNSHTGDCALCEGVIRAREPFKWVYGPKNAAGKLKAHRDCADERIRRRDPNPWLSATQRKKVALVDFHKQRLAKIAKVAR